MSSKVVTGTVVKCGCKGTVKVRVSRRFAHPVCGKTMVRFSHFVAHDASMKLILGSKVKIEPSRPLSSTKRWRVVCDEVCDI